jgi:hypothetical protein
MVFVADPATALRAVSEVQSRQAVATGGTRVIGVEMLRRVPHRRGPERTKRPLSSSAGASADERIFISPS